MAKKASAFTPPIEDEPELLGASASGREPVAASTVSAASGAAPAAAAKGLPSYRVGKRNLSAWIDEKAFNQFKAMVSEEGKTIQDYMIEMVNREFARKGRPQIAK